MYKGQVGHCTAVAEIKAPSLENPKLTNVLPLKPGVGQNIATHASPTAKIFFLRKVKSVASPCSVDGLTEPIRPSGVTER